MGCDIHMVLERKTDSGWLGVHAFPYYRQEKDGHCFPPAKSRNYKRFAMMAGVRGEGPVPRGAPDDASELSKEEFKRWEGDGHSHSWLTVSEAAPIFIATAWDPDEYAKKYPAEHFFGLEDDEVENHRIVFFFDN